MAAGRAGAAGGFGGRGPQPAGQLAVFGNTFVAGPNPTGAGTLTGTIVDSSNAAVPGAQVEARNLTTGSVRSTVSGPEGIFVFNSLEPARYNVTIKATGFKAVESNNLDLTASASLNLGRMPLSLASLTGEIAVTAAATPVQTASSENSKLVDSDQIVDLTLKGRDLFAALVTVPGVNVGTTYLTGGEATSESNALQSMSINGSGARLQEGTAAGPAGTGKLHPLLVALVRHVRSGARPTGEESRLMSGGQVRVHITVTNSSADSLAQLRKAGLTITRQQRNELTGHVAVEKLEAVAQLAFVVWIAPQ
jgi:hypothetical protein